VEDPRQQRPAHQPHDDRPVQAAQSAASEHSSIGVTIPLSLGGTPLSTAGEPASCGVETHAT
jgi:hypothetical protein